MSIHALSTCSVLLLGFAPMGLALMGMCMPARRSIVQRAR